MNPSLLPPRRSPLAGFLRWAATLLLVFGLLFSGYYLYFNVINLAPADVYVVRRGPAVSSVYGTVTISANNAVVLLAQNSGYLHMDPAFVGTPTTLNGQPVKVGQLLATVIDEASMRQLALARQDWESAKVRRDAGPGSATALKAAKDQSAAYEKLPKGSAPQVTVDAAKGEVIRLTAAVENEKIELQRLVDLSLSTLKTYEEQVKRTKVESPIDGILTLVDYGDNAYVLINQALFTISTKEMFVNGQINEEDVGLLKEGMKAELRLYAYPNTTFEATLSVVLPSPVDPNSSRYTAMLTMDSPPDNLRYGLTGEMNIILGKKPSAIVVPARAINVDKALIVEDGVVEQRTVKVGFHNMEYAEILEGILEGALVVVADQDAYKPGDRVRPVPINPVKVAAAGKP